jgi:hypothetical protein
MATERSTDGRARAFLLVTGISFMVVIAVPLFVDPYWWAFTLIALATALVAAVHLRGLIEDSQPTVEHLETGGFAVVCALALWCRPPASAEAS